MGKWTLEQGRDFISQSARIFSDMGYIVGLYGSVLTNSEGRDLDLMVAPMRHRNERSDPSEVMQRLADVFGGLLSKQYKSMMGNEAWTMTRKDLMIVDVSFRIKDYDYLRDHKMAATFSPRYRT